MGMRVALVVVLLALTGGFMFWSSQKGKASSCEANLIVLAGAAEVYVIKEGNPPESIDAMTPKYLKKMPRCEAQPEADYQMNVTEKEIEFYCPGTAHKIAGFEENQPRLVSPIRRPKRPQPEDS